MVYLALFSPCAWNPLPNSGILTLSVNLDKPKIGLFLQYLLTKVIIQYQNINYIVRKMKSSITIR